MKYEKPQRGNPHGLAVNQHIFPAASIIRFANARGLVDVCRKKNGIRFLAQPKDPIFCAKRAWNQRAEATYMRQIERDYQTVAESWLQNARPFLQPENAAITDFYLLCCLRFLYARKPISDAQLGVAPNPAYTKNEEELLERNHIGIIRADGVLSAREITGGRIQVRILDDRKKLKDTVWGVLEATEGEFLVPDNLAAFFGLPLSPTAYLVANMPSAQIGKGDLIEINNQMKNVSIEYYYARNLQCCPC